MHSVVVVDDEHWICKLIYSIVDWNELGFQIVADAGDGKSALQLIRERKPDLVITDIRMPGMDGIELIKSARAAGIASEFIIISGYNDFEYAQSAITYGAFGYLLKPLDEDAFCETLQRVRERIAQKKRIRSTMEAERTRKLEESLYALLRGAELPFSAQECNQRYGTTLCDGLVRAAVIRLDADGEWIVPAEAFWTMLNDWKRACAGNFADMLLCGEGEQTVLALINYSREHAGDVVSACRMLLSMYREMLASMTVPLTVALGVPSEWYAAAESCKSAMNALRARVELGAGGVIDAAGYGVRMNPPHSMIPVNDEKKLLLALELGEEEKAAEQARALLGGAPARGRNSLLSRHTMASELAEMIFSAAKRKGLSQLPAGEADLLRALDDCATPEALEKLLMQTARSFAAAFRSAYSGEDKEVQQIKQYVAAHYQEDITLNDLARLVCLSPNYVSELFKKQTGENFSEYLMDYRVDIAKDLLRDVKYKVVDVAVMVGYSDPKYFSRVFKKRVGVNPNAYKKLYS